MRAVMKIINRKTGKTEINATAANLLDSVELLEWVKRSIIGECRRHLAASVIGAVTFAAYGTEKPATEQPTTLNIKMVDGAVTEIQVYCEGVVEMRVFLGGANA